MTTDSDLIEDFRNAMRMKDIFTTDDIFADGKVHRIHVEGDSQGSKNGWYIVGLDGTPAGAFGCNKRYGEKEKFKWSYKSSTPLTAEERKAFAIKMREIKERKEREERERHEAASVRSNELLADSVDVAHHDYLTRKNIGSHGLKLGNWYITNPDTGETTLVSNNALLVPMRDLNKKVWSLQAIFADKKNILKRDKDFLAGGRQQALFYTIGKPVDKTFIIGEGFATCATIHEVTKHAVVVAFTRGNLMHVARALREKFPDFRIIIAADNDQWTLEPVENPGLTDARAAAIEVHGLLVVPPFAADEKTKPTDFNDLAQLYGGDAVLAEFEKPFDPSIVIEEEDAGAPPWVEVTADMVVAVPPAPRTGPNDDDGDMSDMPDHVVQNVYFSLLGYDRDRYYIFQFEKKQICCFTKSDFSEAGLIELAPLNWWEANFGNGKGGIDKRSAMNALVRIAHRRGIYDAGRIRGRGAWMDKGRLVFHHGRFLTVDGEEMDVTKIKSRFVYELSKSLPDIADDELTDEEGMKLLELAGIFRWAKPGSAALLTGWVALAPMCGAIRWRPHVWITGGAGSGKTTVLNDYVHHLMGGLDLYAQGSSSEAGIRQELKGDALPVLFDESESNSDRESMRIQSVLALIRQASSESQAKTLKGTAGGDALSFHIRSMFCLASIQVGIKFQADIERLTVLSLMPKHEDKNAGEEWASMSDKIYTMQRDETLPSRLFKRVLNLIPVTRQNIKIFSQVAAKRFGSQRDGDQYGTLLAGAWSLISREVASIEQAEIMIDGYDWSEHRENNEVDEGQRAMAALMEAHIKISGVEVSVHELIKRSMNITVSGMTIAADAAEAVLGRYGMRIEGTRLLLSNVSRELRRLMEGTPFEADLRGVLLRIDGANRFANKTVKFSGVSSKCISLPLDDVIDGEEVEYSPGEKVAF